VTPFPARSFEAASEHFRDSRIILDSSDQYDGLSLPSARTQRKYTMEQAREVSDLAPFRPDLASPGVWLPHRCHRPAQDVARVNECIVRRGPRCVERGSLV
jgi:hypothetical protein